jgi:hypothetical protein
MPQWSRVRKTERREQGEGRRGRVEQERYPDVKESILN